MKLLVDMNLSPKMKLIIGLSVVVMFFVACKRTSGPEKHKDTERPMVVEFDGWWANDYAAEAARMKCRADGLSFCEGESNAKVIDARQDESSFEERFSGAFQSDPICSGITLRGFGGRSHRITTVGTLLKAGQAQANLDVTAKEYWLLIVNYIPEEQKQSWTIGLKSSQTKNASGDDDAHSMVHTVCSIVKGTGGSVVE